MKVRVSPYLTVSEWRDSSSGILFSKNQGEIDIPYETDLSNIRVYVNQNYLIVVDGSVEENELKRQELLKVKTQKADLEAEQAEIEKEAKEFIKEAKEEIAPVAEVEKPVKKSGGRKKKAE